MSSFLSSVIHSEIVTSFLAQTAALGAEQGFLAQAAASGLNKAHVLGVWFPDEVSHPVLTPAIASQDWYLALASQRRALLFFIPLPYGFIGASRLPWNFLNKNMDALGSDQSRLSLKEVTYFRAKTMQSMPKMKMVFQIIKL